MSNTGRKFKITYQNKTKKINAPADYKDFKSKCEQLFSIKYKTNILNAKFYDEEECELIVKNQADYKNFMCVTTEGSLYKIVLVPSTPDSDDDDDSEDSKSKSDKSDSEKREDSKSKFDKSDSEKSESVKNDSLSEEESDSEEKKHKKPKRTQKPKAKAKRNETPKPPEDSKPSFKEEKNNSSSEPNFNLSLLEKKLAEIDEKLSKMTKITELENRLNKTEAILNQIKANQETFNQTLITKHDEITQKITSLDDGRINGIKDSVIELSKKGEDNYSTLTGVLKELKELLLDIQNTTLKQSKAISEHHSNNNYVSNNNIMSEPIIEPQYIFDIGNKTIQTTISGLSQVPLMIVYNGNVALPKNFYIANANPNLPITFDPLIINNDEWMPPKTQTIIVPFKVIGQVSSSVIQIQISFMTPNGSPVQMIPINISIISDMIPPSTSNQQQQPVNTKKMYTNVPQTNGYIVPNQPSQVPQSNSFIVPNQPSQVPQSSLAPQEPIQPSQPVPADVPYEPSEEEMNNKINELDRQFKVNSLFEYDDIKDAILKAKGDINKAKEILFD